MSTNEKAKVGNKERKSPGNRVILRVTPRQHRQRLERFVQMHHILYAIAMQTLWICAAIRIVACMHARARACSRSFADNTSLSR